jgi:hypothetical protein
MNKIDNIIINNNIIEDVNKKKTHRFKNKVYKNEQNDILKKIFDIIGITKDNNIFHSHIIDNDESIQNKILEFNDIFKVYYKVSSWPAYKKFDIERRYLSLLKSLLKEMDVEYTSISSKMRYKNRIVNTTTYTINLDSLDLKLE